LLTSLHRLTFLDFNLHFLGFFGCGSFSVLHVFCSGVGGTEDVAAEPFTPGAASATGLALTFGLGRDSSGNAASPAASRALEAALVAAGWEGEAAPRAAGCTDAAAPEAAGWEDVAIC